MSDLAQQIISDVITACKAGVDEAAAAIGRAFQVDLQLAFGGQGTMQSAAAHLDINGPGLIVKLKADRTTVVMTLSANTGIVPDWCAKPDASQASRLATLAQELGMNLLPQTWVVQDFKAGRVDNIADALQRGGVPDDGAAISLSASRAGQPVGTLGLIWPATTADNLFADGILASQSGRKLIGQPRNERPTLALNSADLPSFTRSLLRIKVPVVATLAEKRQKLSRIIELGPGSIIQFDKSCEEMLELEVGNRPVAIGEAVKVGDKFGLRITAISLPDERFNAVKADQSALRK